MLVRIQQLIESFIDLIGRGVSWLSLGLVLLTCLVVLLRYVFDMGWIAMQDAISAMHALLFLLAAAYTLKYDEHVRVDIIYHKLGTRGRAWVDLLGSLLVLLPVCVFIFWISWVYVMESWRIFESSSETGGLPGVYLLKTMILLMAVLLMLQGLAMILKNLAILTSRQPPSHPDYTAEGDHIPEPYMRIPTAFHRDEHGSHADHTEHKG
ncbi:MAG TPA: TRAP transporter small permease subunit [Gammaproteobacteria bacterium]|nr:TRAP transporter small permease subunit [Gammaproteobacteria bacterium]